MISRMYFIEEDEGDGSVPKIVDTFKGFDCSYKTPAPVIAMVFMDGMLHAVYQLDNDGPAKDEFIRYFNSCPIYQAKPIPEVRYYHAQVK